MVKKRGGRRPGSGRKPGPPELVRRNRVVIMLRDEEREKLEGLADRRELPMGTLAYEIFVGALRKRRRY